MSVDRLIGQTVAQRYRVIRKLGRDGPSSVYLAEELATGNPVAVKFLPEELDCDRESLKHCWSEARFATASIPSHVVRVHNVDRTDEGRAFIVMEYLEGESLAEVIRREGPLELDRALRLASQIAQALAATSRAGLVHRDLKPQNVMVLGPAEAVKLTDFGVARLRETVSGGRLRGLGLIASEYTAPEELQGADVTGRADVFSLGTILYTMLTGTVPDGLGDGPAPVRTLRPEVPAALERLVMQAMERDPDLRPSGMEAFAERLRGVAASAVAGPATGSTPDPLPGVPRGPRSPPRRRTLALIGVAGLVVAGLAVWSVLDWRTSGREQGPPPVVGSLVTPDTRTAPGSAITPPAPPSPAPGAVRPREEATQPVPPATPERRAGLPAQADEERRRQARVEAPRPDEGRRQPPETEAARRAREERRRGEVEATRLVEEHRRQQAEAEAAARRVEEERRRQAEAEAAARRAEEERQRQVAAEAAARRAEEERQRQAAAEAAARRAEEERQRQVAAEAAARRAEEERQRQAAAEAAARRAEEERQRQAAAEAAARRAEEERRRQAAIEAARQAEAARVQAAPPVQTARPAAPAQASSPMPALSPQDLARIRAQAEQQLLGRGLLRVSSADRWGVTLEIAPTGVVTLSGALRDMALYDEAIRAVREVPGIRDVTAAGVRVAGAGAPSEAQGDAARIRGEIQQRLRSRGLLRESPADRWGVTVEVGATGEVTLGGLLRDAGLQGEAVRLAQGVHGVRQVKQDIRVAEGAGRP